MIKEELPVSGSGVNRRFSTVVLLAITGVLFFASAMAHSTEAGSEKTDDSRGIRTAFDPETVSWDIEWPGRIARYDPVYLSPPIDPLQGIALGNGDVGVLFWCEDSKIIAVVNKCDLWDDAGFGRFHNWKPEEEEYSTTQRHACRIVIDFKFPVFHTLYLSDFSARLNLADASLTLDAKSPFGKVRLKAFVDHASGVLFCELGSDFHEDIPIEIAVERFGSRTFSHWYSLVNRDASIGLSGTDAGAGDDGAWITQKLTGGTFAAGGAVLHDNGLTVVCSREHSRRSLISLGGGKIKEAQLAFAVTSPENRDPVPEMRKRIASARERGIAACRSLHEEAWKAIWMRSFMDYGDDYLNCLWHLTMYYAHASQGGKYPGRFTNGLWGWDRDVQNWDFYFHWNQQQTYWPLNAAGYHDLVEPYLDFRFDSLPLAREDAQEIFHNRGAYVSDVTERRGYNSLSELDDYNHTPVAEIALDFWRQYRYTGDRKFLREKALPYILDATRFLESRFAKEADGLYHARESTGYEGWIRMKDGLTELVYARALFATAIEALKAARTNVPEAKQWEETLRKLAPLPMVKAGDAAIAAEGSAFRLKRGFFPGRTVPTDAVMAAGWGIKEKKWLTVFSPADDGKFYGFNLLDGIFPIVHLSPVYPSGLVGLAQKGSRLFEVMTTTALLYSPEVMGWDPLPIVLARLGLAGELSRILEHWPERWQIYCNGWGHIGVEPEVKKDAELFFRTNTVRDAASKAKEPETFPFPMWPFRHMSMESMSVLSAAMNESLLQSHEGVLRIAPAFPSDRSGRFTLHAQGGFIVSGEIKVGALQWLCIQSISGNACRVKIPWEKADVHSNWKRAGYAVGGDIAEIKTAAGETLLMVPHGSRIDSWSHFREACRKNEKVRRHSSGKAQVGLPRMF